MFDDAWETALLKDVKPPVIPDAVFPVTEFGARPGADEPQTARLQAAIDEAANRGGGHVVLPSGRFVSGSLRLRSGVDLCLSRPDTVLAFAPDPDESLYPLALSHWETMPCLNFRAPVYALDAHDLSVSGPGTADGQASMTAWWNWHHQMENAWSRQQADLQSADRERLRMMELQGIPAARRVFGIGHYLRPCLVQLIRCQRVLLERVTLQNSPMWMVNPVACQSVICRGLTLRSDGPNSDGIDPESCDGVLIEQCRFETGDDCVSLKAGRNPESRPVPPPCHGVVIRHNRFLCGHGGVAVGSETAGGIFDVAVHHNRFESERLVYALRLKANAARGGRLENLWFHDCEMTHVLGAAIHGTLLYEDGLNGTHPPILRNLCFERIRSRGGCYGICLEGLACAPVTGLELRELRLDDVERPLWAAHWAAVRMADVRINGLRYPRPIAVSLCQAPTAGQRVRAQALAPGATEAIRLIWTLNGVPLGEGQTLRLPSDAAGKRLIVRAAGEPPLESRAYQVLPPRQSRAFAEDTNGRMLRSLGANPGAWGAAGDPIPREALAALLCTLLGATVRSPSEAMAVCAARQLLMADCADETVSRQEMATIVMQVYGAQYRNASTAQPVCSDAERVLPAFATHVARALYFGFLSLDERGAFRPESSVSWAEAVDALGRVARRAWLA